MSLNAAVYAYRSFQGGEHFFFVGSEGAGLVVTPESRRGVMTPLGL